MALPCTHNELPVIFALMTNHHIPTEQQGKTSVGKEQGAKICSEKSQSDEEEPQSHVEASSQVILM